MKTKNRILLIGCSLICLSYVSVFAATETFWDTNWEAMRLSVDENDKVTGEYIYDDGIITGTLQGKILQGWWREYDNAKECGPSNAWSGPLVFQLSDDGQSFTGSWAYCSTPVEDLDPLGNGWTGTKRDSGYTESECAGAGRYWCNDDCQIQACETQITQAECESAGKFWCDETCQYEQCSMNMDTWSYGNEPDADKSDDIVLSGYPVSTCNPAMARAYLYFDISEYPDDVEEVVIGVTHLPHTAYCYSNCNADFYFYPVLEAWQDDTLNYNNMPQEGEAALGPIPISFPNDFGTKEYDITDLYRQWKSGLLSNYGISIHSPTVGCNNAAAMFVVHSLEAEDITKRPYIRVKSKNKINPAIYYLLLN